MRKISTKIGIAIRRTTKSVLMTATGRNRRLMKRYNARFKAKKVYRRKVKYVVEEQVEKIKLIRIGLRFFNAEKGFSLGLLNGLSVEGLVRLQRTRGQKNIRKVIIDEHWKLLRSLPVLRKMLKTKTRTEFTDAIKELEAKGLITKPVKDPRKAADKIRNTLERKLGLPKIDGNISVTTFFLDCIRNEKAQGRGNTPPKEPLNIEMKLNPKTLVLTAKYEYQNKSVKTFTKKVSIEEIILAKQYIEADQSIQY